MSRCVVEQDFLCKRDYSCRRLSRFELAEDVTMIVGWRRRLFGDKGKDVLILDGDVGIGDVHGPSMIVRIEAKVGDRVGRVVLAEEELTRIVGQRDSLLRHLEMNLGRCRQRLALEQKPDGLANSLWSYK